MNQLPADTSWLNTSQVRKVFAALEAARPDGARLVGGCVRNTLMGRPVDDIDIATQLKPKETIKALEASDIRAIPTGIEHGTVTAVVDHIPFEITSLRRDVETDGRHAVVAFTEDWDEDAQRRDFRLNAIYADADGTLFDPTGGGIDDAAAGRVVFIGDADQRLREDYLRILRFFRFNAWYGAQIDPAGLAACARNKDGLRRIAAERIWKELKKTLSAPDPVGAVEVMDASGVLDILLPEHVSLDGLHDLTIAEQLTGQSIDPILRLMSLIVRGSESVRDVAKRLRLANVETRRLEAWAVADVPDMKGLKASTLRASLYRDGQRALIDRFMLLGVDARDVVAASAAWRRPVFPLKGADLVKQGMTRGPEIGNWLRKLEDWWIAGDFTADKAELLEELERRLKAD